MFFDVKTFRKYIVTLCRLFAVKECDGPHSEHYARRVPTLRVKRNA